MEILSGKTVYHHLINSTCKDLEFGVEVLQNGTFSVMENLNLSKNHTFRVDFEFENKKHSLFLKQPKREIKSSMETVINEYKYLYFAQYKSFNNDLLDFDKENVILITKSSPDFIGLTTDIYKTKNGYTHFAASASKILFDFHERFKAEKKDSLYYLSVYKPELIQTDRRRKMTEAMWSVEDFKIRQIAEKIEIAELIFESIGNLWYNDETIIHRDLKYSNFLVNNNKDPKEYKLVDYELAAIGDRCWDLSEFIFQLLRKKSSKGNIEEDPQWIRSNLYDFSNLIVLNYYNMTSGLDKEQFFKKVLSFFVVRLIQSYVSSVFSNLWDDNKKTIEFNNIIYFWNIIDNHFETESADYFTNYMKNI
jgi:thiamine kinase-like enzyme